MAGSVKTKEELERDRTRTQADKKRKADLEKTVRELKAQATKLRANGWQDLAKQDERKAARLQKWADDL